MTVPRITYLPEELAWIEERKDWKRSLLHTAFCNRFGRRDVSFENFKKMCNRKGWKTGRTGHFEAGQVAHNKGKPKPYHPNSAANWFQKGNRPHSAREPGHEMVDKRDGYVWMIVAERNPYTGAATRRVQKHRWLWERAHGKVPDGHVLKCLDGDKTNTDPSNWEAIPQALLPRLNGRFGREYDSAPAEVKPTIMAIAKLEHQAREARRGRQKQADAIAGSV